MKNSEQADKLIAMSILSKERHISYGQLQTMLASGEVSESEIMDIITALRNSRKQKRSNVQ